MAILARALYLTFPEQANLFNIGAMRLGGQIIPNHNNLLGRYPGADGMKTGFTCAAGWNIVASASQGDRKLIAVILGAPNLRSRTIMAAALFDRGFAGIDRPSKSLADLVARTSMNGPAAAPDMHQTICSKRGKAVAQFNTELISLMAPLRAAKAKAPGVPRILFRCQSALAIPCRWRRELPWCRVRRSTPSLSMPGRPRAMRDLSRKPGRPIRRSAPRNRPASSAPMPPPRRGRRSKTRRSRPMPARCR